MPQPNFNLLAPVYDIFAQLVFGNNLKLAQKEFLHRIKAGDKVLLIGGGTGRVLEEIEALGINIELFYVESSSKMMAISKSRKLSDRIKVTFIEKPFLEAEIQEEFDVICTFFFLDLFSEDYLAKTIKQIKKLHKSNGLWLFADFSSKVERPVYHRILVQSMFIFFRISANVSVSKFLDYPLLIKDAGYTTAGHSSFKKGLIISRVFMRN